MRGVALRDRVKTAWFGFGKNILLPRHPTVGRRIGHNSWVQIVDIYKSQGYFDY